MKDFHTPTLYGCIAGLLVLHVMTEVRVDNRYVRIDDVVDVVERLEGVDVAVAKALESMSFLLTNHVQDVEAFGHGVYGKEPLEFWGSLTATNYPVISVMGAER